jgi:O-antigen ligase
MTSISSKHILYFHLLLSIGFYLGFTRFVGRVIGFGGAQGDFEAAAAGNPVNQAAALLLLLMSLLLLFKSSRVNTTDLLRQGWIWLLLIAFFVISILWSSTPFISFRRIVAFSTIVLVCFVLANSFNARSLLNLIANAIVAAVVIGVVYQVYSGQKIVFGLTEQGAGLRGIFGDKNAAARTYAYGLLIFVGLEKYKTKLEIIGLVILVCALSVAQSASAIILAGLGCGLIITFKTFRGHNKRQNARRFAIALVLLLFGALIVVVLYDYLLQLLGRDQNLTDRTIIWRLITPFIESKPIIGYGFGSFWAGDYVTPFIERWGFIGNAHSGYLEAMLHGGLIGLGLLLTMLVLFVKAAIHNYLSLGEARELSELLLSICIVQIVLNYIGYIILNHNGVDMFIFLIAFFIVRAARKRETDLVESM